MSKGYFTIAQNSGKKDYLRMAYALALSLKATQEHNKLSVAITPGQHVPDKYKEVFDEIIDIPWGDHASGSEWKLENEWKVFHITPYEETIKLDADMLFLDNIDKWWDILQKRDVWATTQVLTYRHEIATSMYYRKEFVDNHLPNIYTAFMYFKKSDLALDLFKMAEIIYFNWEKFNWDYCRKRRFPVVNTDGVFALAMKLLDITEDCTLPGQIPTFVHMKSFIQNWNNQRVTENWMEHVPVSFTNDLTLKIGVHKQSYPFHYHLKEFLVDDIIEKYEKHLGI